MIKVIQILQNKMQVFSYVVYDIYTNDCAVIDPSTEPEKILKTLDQNNLNLKAVINTHGHPDHVCGNSYILKNIKAPLYIHKKDAYLLGKISSRLFSRALGGKSSPSPDYFVEDNDIIESGSFSFEVIHTPGHTPGGICLFTDKNLFTGDTLFTGDVGRTDLPGASYEELVNSVKNRLFTLAPDTVVWPGHNYSEDKYSTIEKEKRTNPYIS
jgi:glyoxylase-like metal-dependent hydrolase (beta-lactamase superfamily II)